MLHAGVYRTARLRNLAVTLAAMFSLQGAVGCLRGIHNAIGVARAVMEHTTHTARREHNTPCTHADSLICRPGEAQWWD